MELKYLKSVLNADKGRYVQPLSDRAVQEANVKTVVNYIKNNPDSIRMTIIEETELSESTVNRALIQLREAGTLIRRRIGITPYTYRIVTVMKGTPFTMPAGYTY